MIYTGKLRGSQRVATMRNNAVEIGRELARHPIKTVAAAVGVVALGFGAHLLAEVNSDAAQNAFNSVGESCVVTTPAFNLGSNNTLDSSISAALAATPNAGKIVGFDVTVASAGSDAEDQNAELGAMNTMDVLDGHENLGMQFSSVEVVQATADFDANSVRVAVVAATSSCDAPNAEYLA